jgi:hypothetical protein
MIFEIKNDIEKTIDLIKNEPRITTKQILVELEKIVENINTKKKSKPIPIPYENSKYNRHSNIDKNSLLDASLVEEMLDKEREKLREKWLKKQTGFKLEKNLVAKQIDDDFFFFDLDTN